MSNSIVGAKKKERKPRIAVDSAASISTAKLLYGLAEGEVYGLADGAKSIRLDGTPLVDDNGNGNFNGVRWTFAAGTNDQEHISGFPDVTNEVGVGVELRSDNPWIKAFNDTQLSAVRVRFKWGRLSKTNPDNGDVNGHTIKYAIDLQTDGGAYHEIINTKIQEKTSAGYERTHRIDLPKAKTGWQLRVRRLTPNDPSEYVQDTMMIEAVAEVIDVKLSYPNTALLGIEYNAEIFSSVAKIAVRVKGKIIRVPDNYDPVARTYTGIWTGNFKDAYSNNPAWVFYDLCTQWRGGLGERLDATMIDRWSLYALGQYCDQPVSDGQGGLEPRFTCNVYLQKQEEAYTVLQNIAGIFRAMSFWTGERIMLDADVPQDPIYTYSSANIVGGVAGIQYSGTRARDRHTLAKVAWDNPNNDYQTEYEYVRDEKAMSKFGVKVLDLSAFGCTSQAQAQRAGLWALKTEQLETRQVTFSVGLDGAIPTVGNIISLSDEAFAGRANGGRVSTVNSTQRIIELDREVVASVGDVLIINGGSGKSERRNISNVVGNRITVTAAFTSAEPEHIWAVETADLKLMRFRVMSIIENDDATYAITAIQHEPQKYDAIDFGTDVKPTEITIINPDTVDAPASVTITSRHREVQGQTVTTLIISWSQVKGAVAYDAEWRKDDGTWIKLPRTGNVSAEIDGVYSGNYLARVRAISAFEVQSQATTSTLTAVEGKIGLPPTVVGLTATGVLFGMDLKWGFQAGSGDAAFTEIQVGSAPNVNVATLGQYSYPTNTHTINGLQGNLKQSYRARLVDKLGFKSPWSAWVTGTTDADANKILDIIDGEIKQSHLYQELSSKIDKVSKIEPLELLVGDETKGLVKAIADERDARIDAIGTSALEGSESLHERADALAGTVNGITEWQDVVDTDIEKGFAKMTYLASELDFGYADKTQFALKARGTAWTFAKTVARADYVNSELARGLTADLAGAKASFTEQITATAAKNFAATQKIENLSAQVVGGYEGNDLGALSSGLLYQESTARASDYSALAEQISLLSAGVGEQFDPYQIWHFDKDSEGWTGGTYNGGYINARTDKLQSPSMSRELDDDTVETLNTSAYHYIKMRLEVVGTPTWSGLVEWSGGSATITEPVVDEGVANISFDLKWSGSIDSFTIKIAETADNLNYYKVDWIAVGRPSPGASSAAVLDIKRAFSAYEVSSSEKLTDLTSTIYGNNLTPLTASIREQLNTLATDSSTYAGTLSVLDTWYKGEDASMAAITKQQYEALTSADSANARKVDELFAEMDFGYADRTKYANINRSMQRTLATTIAVADWTQNQRIDTLQSEFQGNTSQIQNELLTLASKDLSIASEQTRLSTAIGENSADILNLSLAVTSPESGLAAQVTQLQATAEAAERLAGTKGEIIYSVAEPPTKDQLPQNLWFKKEGENTTPHVWDIDSGKWVALTDKAAADAQAEANAAKQAAGIAQGAAEAKGEVIFSNTAPEAAKQLAQNLWIDTSLVDGKPANTPMRWDGLDWVEVTDKATKDAASAASAAQGAAQAAQGAADDAAGAAALAQGELDDISDDDKLTPSEKKQLRIIVDDIKQVDTDIKARAAKYEVSTTEYDKAYKELVTDYINDLLADHDKTSNIVRTEFNRKFNEFFAERAQLDTSIAIAAKSVADGLKSDLSLGYASRNKYASKRTIPNSVATAIARAQLQANEANMAVIEAQDSAQNARNAADVAQGQVNDIASDSKLTPVEKKQVKLIIDDIKQVDADIKSRAAKYEVSTTEYGNAYTALVTNYINALLVNPNATDNIDRNVFNEKFNTFFTKRAQLDTAITVAAKKVADDAQGAANEAQGAASAAAGAASAAAGAASAAKDAADEADRKARVAQGQVDDISADGKLTPVEKKQANLIWSEIARTDTEVRANAAKHKVSITTYSSAYTALNTYLNGLITGAEANTTSIIDRAAFDKAFADVYAARAEVNKLIVVAAEKQAADAASAADAAQGTANDALGAAQAAQGAADAAEGKAQKAKEDLSDIYSDGKVTPSEKQQIKTIWTEIVETDAGVRDNAAKYDVGLGTYPNAYTNLESLVNALLLDMNATTNVNRTTLDGRFEIYYRRRAVVNRDIVAAAEKQAADAQDTANDKGEVITSDKIPATTKRLPQNLWIDTRQGKNTPRRWNGSAWEAVTDQAAIDAVDDVKLNLATYVKESGAYSTEFGNIAGEITTIQSTVEGVTDSIEVVAAIGDAERLKYEISKERLNKNKAALQGKVADLDSLIAKYKAQRTDAQAKKAEATDATVIAAYDAQIALLSTSITDTEAQRSEVSSQVAQMEQEITELASLKLTESEVKKQYFVKFDSGNRAAGFGIMENADATIDFAVLADKFYIAPPSGTGKGVRPFAVYTSPTTINGVTVPAGTYIDGDMIATGAISGDKISAQTEIDAPIIKGGQININDKFIVDADGNLTGKSGKFEGTVLADKIEGKVANIADLAVDTLQIAGNAVTIPLSAFTAAETSSFGGIGGGSADVQQITVPATEGRTAITFSASYNGSGSSTGGGTLVGSFLFSLNGSTVLNSITVVRGTGDHYGSTSFSWLLPAGASGVLKVVGHASGGSMRYSNRFLSATVHKR